MQKQNFKNEEECKGPLPYITYIKHSNICITGIPEEETDKRTESVFEEIMAEKLS